MQVLYIDVYFLINFTVDFLSLFFTVKLMYIRISFSRLIICSLIGGLGAVVYILMPEWFGIRLICSCCILLLIGILLSVRLTLVRRVKAIALFLICEALLGGLVHFGYSMLDRLFDKTDFIDQTEPVNRKALLFSVLILLSIGVFKLLVMLFSVNQDKGNVKLMIEVGGKTVETDALIDTGNLVTDPMSMCPVIFIKSSLADKILPKNIIELSNIDELDVEYKKRIRLIPVTKMGQTHVMTGFRPDRVAVYTECWEDANFTLAIDKEGGTFGGYEALAPSAVMKNVI